MWYDIMCLHSDAAFKYQNASVTFEAVHFKNKCSKLSHHDNFDFMVIIEIILGLDLTW